MKPSPCPGCGAITDPGPAVPHDYMTANWGCWEAFGEIRGREMQEPGYGVLAQRSVDTYAVQHPGEPGRRENQSVAVHLMSLCLQLEGGVPPHVATRTIGRFAHREYPRFEIPEPNGDLTVLDVRAARTAERHVELVERWAEGVWRAWSRHHGQVRGWLDELSR